jgi:hypothetical protein
MIWMKRAGGDWVLVEALLDSGGNEGGLLPMAAGVLLNCRATGKRAGSRPPAVGSAGRLALIAPVRCTFTLQATALG